MRRSVMVKNVGISIVKVWDDVKDVVESALISV